MSGDTDNKVEFTVEEPSASQPDVDVEPVKDEST